MKNTRKKLYIDDQEELGNTLLQLVVSNTVVTSKSCKHCLLPQASPLQVFIRTRPNILFSSNWCISLRRFGLRCDYSKSYGEFYIKTDTMNNDRNVLISLETQEDEDKPIESREPGEISTNQDENPATVLNLAMGEIGESSSDAPRATPSENIQRESNSTDQPTGGSTSGNGLPQYMPWQCVDAYRPRPEANCLSDRPPIPQGIPPPPYFASGPGVISPAELQSQPDEPPPEYPGPPQVFNPSGNLPPQYPAGSRPSQALERDRQREISRLIVLSAVMNACDERTRRNPQQTLTRGQVSQRQFGNNRARTYGVTLALGVLVLVFTVIGVALGSRKSSNQSSSWKSSDYGQDYNYERTTTTKAPSETCLTFQCKNGGRCDDVLYSSPRCLCKSAYYGTHCQYNKYDTIWKWNRETTTTRSPLRYDVCSPVYNRCLNGGTCLRSVFGNYCLCFRGFEGPLCERRKPPSTTTTSSLLHEQCSENLCLNGGSCWFSALNGRNCDCAPGYAGYKCETRLDL